MTLMETLEHHRTLDNLYNSHTKPHLMTLAERQEHIGNLESQTKTPGIVLNNTQEYVALLLKELDAWKKLNGNTLGDDEWRKIFPF
ncbi:hypothetical protein HOO68_03675 [Candidatus Gracilibacteria bacterium]|nr:hypothetical protein [Candidatus Gracilibacteria bacterium]